MIIVTIGDLKKDRNGHLKNLQGSFPGNEMSIVIDINHMLMKYFYFRISARDKNQNVVAVFSCDNFWISY
jgi:hypothetical protein